MKLLVTGGAGFIGSNFVRYWSEKHPEDKIIIYDKLTYAGHLTSLKDVLKIDEPQDSEFWTECSSLESGNIQFIKGDIADEAMVDVWMEGVDIVVNFAAESHVDRSIMDPFTFVKTNVLGTTVLLQAALNKKVKRFHHISTDEVYGSLGPNDPPFVETTPFAPRSPYAASKAAAEEMVMAYYITYGLPVTITNCADNYGPYHDPEKLIPRFVTNLIEGKLVPLMGKGENIREWLYVIDHARAIELVLEKGKVGEKYLIAGTELPNIEVTKKILADMGKDESYIEEIPHRLGHDFRYAIDDSKIRELGFEPSVDFETGLKDTINWYKQNEWWWKPLKENRPNVDPENQKKYES